MNNGPLSSASRTGRSRLARIPVTTDSNEARTTVSATPSGKANTTLYSSGAAHAAVHPVTVRHWVRRLEKLLPTSLTDPEVRLPFSLTVRMTELSA
jgi:hypothetical protein